MVRLEAQRLKATESEARPESIRYNLIQCHSSCVALRCITLGFIWSLRSPALHREDQRVLHVFWLLADSS